MNHPCSLELQRCTLPTDCLEVADALNRSCACISVDHARLTRALAADDLAAPPSLLTPDERLLAQGKLFSDTVVFVAAAQLQRMQDAIEVIERVVRLPAWEARALAQAPSIAQHATKASGVFMGYDFHLGATGPQLIEINTNAGGALLNAKLLRAQQACCAEVGALFPPQRGPEAEFVAMFREEWALARGATPLRRVAIVDTAPATQFLALEFELCRQLLDDNGIATVIAAPDALVFDGQTLSCGGETIDLVYNRLTDFALEDADHAALRAAYLADAVVLTPHPRAHALYADKRNLVALSDDACLAQIGVAAADRELLQAVVPRTVEVTPANAADFWTNRAQWFFKPSAGYGSKATYRGDKLTRRVFDDISRGGYVAQTLVAPSRRRLLVDGVKQELKVDLRNYVYRGAVQLVSARLYQGQTTNFRTPGGGFATVFAIAVDADKPGR